MRDQGLGSWPARRRRLSPDHVALRHGDAARTYAELDDRRRHLAGALRARGVGRGDRVAYLGTNDPALLETLFATTALGAVFVPLNWRLTVAELTWIAADCGASVLVHATDLAATAEAVAADPSTAVRHRVALGPGYESLAGGSPGAGEPPVLDEPVALDDPAVIIYTSGTAGRPKGATLSHGNVTWNCVNVLVDTDLASDEVALVCAPLFHVAALDMVAMPMVAKGGTTVLTGSFDPAEALDLIERHGVTVMFGVPAMFNAMAQVPAFEGADLSSLRRLLCGGAPVPLSTIRTYLDRGIPFLQGYGMTETAPGALFLGAERAADKAGTAGVPSFFTDVRVVRPDGSDVAPGEKGEVVVAGPNVMLGYWNRPDATADAMDGEWFRSGDVAVVDDEGYVAIVDRIKDMIISGGENVYPAEVEDAIYSHPGVAECAVIGVPDARWGEVGRAVVVRRDGPAAAGLDEQALLDHLDGRLARYKVPRSVVFTDGLPRSGAGKVLKERLRDVFGGPG
ncbi:MAG TPA: long-chain fatty acid--CoA ligase [Acidimicrobiales bacterium]|nr:long-chain fatty acid--CoA ligase [Acidimicrobiales bacterium]